MITVETAFLRMDIFHLYVEIMEWYTINSEVYKLVGIEVEQRTEVYSQYKYILKMDQN